MIFKTNNNGFFLILYFKLLKRETETRNQPPRTHTCIEPSLIASSMATNLLKKRVSRPQFLWNIQTHTQLHTEHTHTPSSFSLSIGSAMRTSSEEKIRLTTQRKWKVTLTDTGIKLLDNHRVAFVSVSDMLLTHFRPRAILTAAGSAVASSDTLI